MSVFVSSDLKLRELVMSYIIRLLANRDRTHSLCQNISQKQTNNALHVEDLDFIVVVK